MVGDRQYHCAIEVEAQHGGVQPTISHRRINQQQCLMHRTGGADDPRPRFEDLVFQRNSQAPPLDGYAERSSTSSFGGTVSARRMLTPCFRAVEMTERMAAHISAPTTVRNPPEIVIRSFIMRMSRSAWLLVNGTSKSAVNRSTSALRSRRRSSRVCPGRRGGLPRAPGVRRSGAWPSCKANPKASAAS